MAKKKRKPSKTASLKTSLKRKGLRLPHGYDVVVRKTKKKKNASILS